jgi:chemotaxis-related protein WspD
MSNLSSPTITTKPCWKTIGIEGDRGCPELTALIHCRNCDVYARGGRDLFNRELPVGYQADWTQIIATTDRHLETSEKPLSLTLFRLHDEWFALTSAVFEAISPIVPIRRIPQRSNDRLLGLVNINGELQLCLSLSSLLGVTPNDTPIPERLIYPRMAMIQASPQERWVFPIDELQGIERIAPASLQTTPSNFKHHITQAIFDWQGRSVSYLNEVALLAAMSAAISKVMS